VADVSGLWQLIDVMGSGDSEAPPSIVTVDTGACQCTAWQPDHGPLCLTVIRGVGGDADRRALDDEGSVRRYALISRCFGSDEAHSGRAVVVVVGCESGLIAWFAFPRPPHTASSQRAVPPADVPLADERVSARQWRLCDGAVVDLLLLILRPGQDFKSCRDTFIDPADPADTVVKAEMSDAADAADASAMVVVSESAADTVATFTALHRADLSTHLCAVVQPRHRTSTHPSSSQPLLALECDGVRSAACGIVVGDDCVLSVSSASGPSNNSSSSSRGGMLCEYVGSYATTSTDTATVGDASTTGVSGDGTGSGNVCALLLIVDGALHACVLAATQGDDKDKGSGQLVSSSPLRLLPPRIIVGQGDGYGGPIITACAVSRTSDRTSTSSSDCVSARSNSSSSSSSSSSQDPRHPSLWLLSHNHRTGDTDAAFFTHPLQHPHPHPHPSPPQPNDGHLQYSDGDVVQLLRQLCGTAAASDSAGVVETSSLIQDVMGRMEAAAADEKGERWNHKCHIYFHFILATCDIFYIFSPIVVVVVLTFTYTSAPPAGAGG
jgi:hypothetical protein